MSNDMIGEHHKHCRSHIDLHVTSALADCEYDQTMTITLPMWRWMAISSLAASRGITSTDLVTRWIDERVDRLASHTVHIDRG